MILRSLRGENYGPFRRVDLEFPEEFVAAVEGEYANKPGRSNEAGKTSLLSLIRYSIHGKGDTKDERELLHTPSRGPMLVESNWTDPSMTITRTMKDGGRSKLSITGMEGEHKNIAQAEVEAALGLSYEDFLATSCFVQGDLHRFIQGDKKAFLMRWLGRTYWSELADDSRREAASEEKRLERILGKLSDEEEVRSRLFRAEAGLSQLRNDIEEAKRRKAIASRKFDSQERADAALRQVEKAKEDTKEASQVHHIMATRRDELKNKQTTILARLRTLRDGGKLYCDYIESDGCKAFQHDGQVKLEEESKGLNKTIRKAKRTASRTLDTLKAAREEEARLQKLAKGADAEQVKTLRQKLKNRIKELKVLQHQAIRLEEEVHQHDRRLDEMDKLSLKLDRVRQTIAVHRYLSFMFGKTGIPSMQIENAIGEVEDDTNLLLEDFGSELSVGYEATEELRVWEPSCLACGTDYARGQKKKECLSCGAARERKRRDRLRLVVYQDGTERPFDLISGGAKGIISIATRIALANMVARQTGRRSPILLLDEIFAMLDVVNRANVVETILTRLRTSFGYRQILVISHFPDVIECIEDRLVVNRKKRHSIVRWRT